MQEFVQQRLRALLKRPNGWGPPHAVELQLLLLVEMWHVTQGASQEHVDTVAERYSRYLGNVLPHPSPLPLALRLGLTNRATDRFVEILREFALQEGVPGDNLDVGGSP